MGKRFTEKELVRWWARQDLNLGPMDYEGTRPRIPSIRHRLGNCHHRPSRATLAWDHEVGSLVKN